MKFLKKWREFLEGGMKAGFFLQNGKHPIGQEGRKEGHPAGQMGLRADGPPGRFIFHWKLFPSCSIVRFKYKSKNNNINL